MSRLLFAPLEVRRHQRLPFRYLRKGLLMGLVFVLMTGWIFSGWPQIWPLGELGTGKIQIPPKIQEALAGTVTYDTDATHVWSSPVGVTSVDVECWGAGAAGGAGDMNLQPGGGGGGGGAYAKTTGISITGDTDYNVVVGAGGAGNPGDGPAGGDSYFHDGIQIKAKGGTGGLSRENGGTGGAGGTGSTYNSATYDGGGGADGADVVGGGGGESAGAASIGTTATGQTGASGVEDGGDGGNGGNAGVGGFAGVAPGGAGGGGGQRSGGAEKGGSGAAGKCILTWTDPLATTILIRNVADTEAVTTITFPAGDASAVVSNPTGNIDTQVLTDTAVDAAPVAILTSGSAYTLWFNVTAASGWADTVASEKIYTQTIATDLDLTAFGTNAKEITVWDTAVTATPQALEAGVDKELFLQITLTASWGKTGSSTLTVLGET